MFYITIVLDSHFNLIHLAVSEEKDLDRQIDVWNMILKEIQFLYSEVQKHTNMELYHWIDVYMFLIPLNWLIYYVSNF